MGSIWAIARHTVTYCLRTKVAVMFIALLALALLTLPFVLTGDGTLCGRIQTFLAYSSAITITLLIIVTIFLSVRVVSGDVHARHILTVATKPLARWQYILGRWAGIVLLDVMLLAVASGAIYGAAQYLHSLEPINPEDNRKIETEVFAAREKVLPDPVDIEPLVRKRIRNLKQNNEFDDALSGFLPRAGGNKETAVKLLLVELRKQIRQSRQSVPPGRVLKWNFSGINVGDSEKRCIGRVRDIRDAKPNLDNKKAISVRDVLIDVPPAILGRLVYYGPVQVNKVTGMVVGVEKKSFIVRFFEEDAKNAEISSLKKGAEVTVLAEPLIQLTYKISPAEPKIPDNVLQGIWQIRHPKLPIYYPARRRPQKDPARTVQTMTIPARVVDSEGKTIVMYLNANHPDLGAAVATSVSIADEDIAILYRAGDFGPNFARGMILIVVQLMFLAALGVFCGCFLSFPVACLLCFAVLPFGLMGEFLTDAVKLPAHTDVDWTVYFGHYALKTMRMLLPNLAETSPSDSLVGGEYISWLFLGRTALLTVAVRTVLVLGLACLIFHKRELARVQG